MQAAAIEAFERVWQGLTPHQQTVLQDTARDFATITLSLISGHPKAPEPVVLADQRKRGTGLLAVGTVLLGRTAIQFADILLDPTKHPQTNDKARAPSSTRGFHRDGS